MVVRTQTIAGLRARAARFAVLGTLLPVLIATFDNFDQHRLPFFAGATGACLAPIVLATVPRSRRVAFWAAAFGAIPALTLMQSYTGGVTSGYSMLLIMAMIWFGVDGTDTEQIGGVVVLAACCYLPMVLFGAPAYPVSWGHATMLVLIGCLVAGWLRLLTREMQALNQRLRKEAVVDELTGLLNRRGWLRNAPRELVRSARSGFPTALVAIDLDKFKQLNDQSGHHEGDRVLRETAERIRDTLRAGDVVARLGGDEFIALLTNTTRAGALAAIERLRASTPTSEAFSAGIAIWDRSEDLAALTHRADLALYDAKGSGGGRTGVAPTALAEVPRPLKPTPAINNLKAQQPLRRIRL